jgi:hypothetical protein
VPAPATDGQIAEEPKFAGKRIPALDRGIHRWQGFDEAFEPTRKRIALIPSALNRHEVDAARYRAAMTRTSLHALLLVLLASTAAPAQDRAITPAKEASPKALAPLRVGILGASVSDGFGCRLAEQREDGLYEATFRLADMLPLVCPERAMRIENRASSSMFFAPHKNGCEAAKLVRESEPQCVLALDYLFWFCYGNHAPKDKPEAADEARLASLELGLAELAAFRVPVVVGDIPDMSKAVGKMLRASQMPSLEAIAAANARIAAWAAERPHVHVVPVSRLIRQLHDEQKVEIAGKPFVATPEQPLLQRDDLHATPAGLAAITCVLVDTLQKAAPELSLPGDLDPAAVIERARGTLVKKAAPKRRTADRDGR